MTAPDLWRQEFTEAEDPLAQRIVRSRPPQGSAGIAGRPDLRTAIRQKAEETCTETGFKPVSRGGPARIGPGRDHVQEMKEPAIGESFGAQQCEQSRHILGRAHIGPAGGENGVGLGPGGSAPVGDQMWQIEKDEIGTVAGKCDNAAQIPFGNPVDRQNFRRGREDRKWSESRSRQD